ncbi:GNAT family N-acetyltransferase [Psychrobacillus sp. NPDC058041]|uniref:GNAT family N-acetyltransferase n=1 Tax=Psychrobacillus sp. NPDC058041 TaxID=3346310 RepID=UPI0036DA457E
MEWRLLKFEEFDVNLLYEVLKLRVDVFVVEQNCAYPDLDTYDQQSLHLMCIEKEEVIAYCRVLPPGEKYDVCSIGRVIVKEKARGTGVARQLMIKAIEEAEDAWNIQTIQLCAQSHLQRFYESLGFITMSDIFDEDGIPHVNMVRNKR